MDNYRLIYPLNLHGDNVNYYTSVDHPIPTLPVGKGNKHPVNFKTTQKGFLSIEYPVMFPSSPKWMGGEDLLLRVQEGGNIVRLPSRVLGCHQT